MLFIYDDNFNDYSSGTKDKGTGNNRYRMSRKDSKLPNQNDSENPRGMNTLGIPTGYSTADKTKGAISSTNYDYSNPDDFEFINKTTTYTDFFTNNNYDEILKKSMKNIYDYIKKFKIQYIFYPTYKNEYDTDKKEFKYEIPKIDLDPFLGKEWTTQNKNALENQFMNLIKNIIKINNNYEIEDINNEDANPANPANPQIPATPQNPPIPATPQTNPNIPPSPQGVANRKQEKSLEDYSISNDNFLVDGNNKKIDVRAAYNYNFVDKTGNVIDMSLENKNITIKGKKGKINSDGTIYFNPSEPENNPIRSIVSIMQKPDNQKYENNIKIITNNTDKINDQINKIIEPKSEFMLLTERVQELSNLLFKLSQIEPKVINVQLDKPKPLALQYSWILKPVQLNKSEFHGLKGTETLDKLIKEDKAMNKFYKDSTSFSDSDIDKIIEILGSAYNPTLTNEQSDKINNINLDSLVGKCLSKISNRPPDNQNTFSSILYNNLIRRRGTVFEKYKDKFPYTKSDKDSGKDGGRNKGGKNRGGRGGRDGRGGYGGYGGQGW